MRCLAAGYTDHALCWEGAGHGGVQDYRQGDGNDHKRGTSEGNCYLETLVQLCLGYCSFPTEAHMESYTQAPPGSQSAWGTLVPTP